MFTPGPSKEDIAKMMGLGLTPEDYAGDPVSVWPENERPYVLFAQLQTQWRTGAMGPTGLDYNTLYHKMDRMRLEPDEYERVECDVRVMEFAALEVMNSRD